MPHASGGGSHSSGSHYSGGSSHSSGGGSHSSGTHYSSSSSYSSSGSYGRSSGSSIGSSYSAPKIRKERFQGSRKYVRYRNNRAEYIYSNRDPGTYKGGTLFSALQAILKFLLGLNLLILAASVFFTFVYSLGTEKITADYKKTIIIEDEAELFGDLTQLKKSLKEFQDLTGITPSILTIHNEYWQKHYATLADYAYDIYLNSFGDEYHWLIVYSEPTNPDPEFNDWYFEGMQGDDTDSIITSTLSRHFTDNLQKGLMQKSTPLETAFANAFSEATKEAEGIMHPTIDVKSKEVFIAMFILMVLAPFFILKIMKRHIKKKYEGYVPVKSKSSIAKANTISNKRAENQKAAAEKTQNAKIEPRKKQRNCEYCNAMYFVGTVTECPRCGAPVRAEED